MEGMGLGQFLAMLLGVFARGLDATSVVESSTLIFPLPFYTPHHQAHLFDILFGLRF
jgi:hypothetical protein